MNYCSLAFPQIYEEAEAVILEVQTRVGALDAHQLNWKPSAGSWSVGQCLDHVIAINGAFEPVFRRILAGEHTRRRVHRLPVLPGLFGQMMIRAVSPDGGRKFKAPRVAEPALSAIDPGIVDRFVGHQRELLAKMKALGAMDPAAVIIRSPFAPIFYSLLDAFRIIVAHERRHLAQARRVMASPGFPSAGGRG